MVKIEKILNSIQMKNSYFYNFLVNRQILILLILILSNCKRPEPEPIKHELIKNYFGIDYNKQFYFDTGSFWIYQDLISKKMDTVKTTYVWAASHILQSDKYDFLVQHGQVDFYSTFQKKKFIFKFDFPDYRRITAHHYHTVDYLDDKNTIYFFTSYIWDAFPNKHPDSLYLNSGETVYADKTTLKLNGDSVQLFLAGDLGIAKKQIFNKKTTQLKEDWEVLKYKIKIPKY